MKKANSNENTLRSEYTRADFPDGFVRGKFLASYNKDANFVLLNPEIIKKATKLTNPSSKSR